MLVRCWLLFDLWGWGDQRFVSEKINVFLVGRVCVIEEQLVRVRVQCE
jgi:hypothetical protein